MYYTLIACFVLLTCAFILFYIRFLLLNMNGMSEDIVKLGESLEDFNNHLTKLYNSEIFYGDETLEKFLKHANDINQELKDFNILYNMFSETEESPYDNEEEDPPDAR